jgi:hypothetical protein
MKPLLAFTVSSPFELLHGGQIVAPFISYMRSNIRLLLLWKPYAETSGIKDFLNGTPTDDW